MVAFLHQTALPQDVDPVRVPHIGEAMSDQDDGAVRSPLQLAEQRMLGAGIEGRGGFVADE